MPVRLRMQRFGAKKRPFYRVVAADKRAPRDGRFIELLGTFDPLQEPPIVRLHKDRIDYWIDKGAQPSQTVASLIGKLNNGNAINLSDVEADKRSQKERRLQRQAELEASRKKTIDQHKASEEKEKEAKEGAPAKEAAVVEAQVADNAADDVSSASEPDASATEE